ncbi:aspartate aminotransferase family protein [Gemmatimonadota bacterium]
MRGVRSENDVETIIQADKEFVWHHIKPHQVFELQEQMVVAEGEGLILRDIRGREYLDATSGGVWSVILGYGQDRIAEAVCDQLKAMPYYAGTTGNIPAAQLAERLISLMPGMGRVFFSNSGSEANEKAFKLIRQGAHMENAGNGKHKVLFRHRDYHGTTLGALSASGQPERREGFGPLCPGFSEFPHALCYRCPFEAEYPACDVQCARAVETAILEEGPDTVGGVIVEPITAGGGIIPPVPEYYTLVHEICRKYGVLLIMDEVVCGFGRTGTWWGYEQYDVIPDMVTLAKGMASSYEPLSATVVRQSIFDRFVNDINDPGQRLNFFRDISTYGGCTGPMRAALETIQILEEENLIENSRVMGAHLLEGLKELHDLPIVGDVRGMGLFCGVEFVQDKATKTPITEGLMATLMGGVKEEGVLVGRTYSSIPGNNTIMNFAPALTISRDQVDTIVSAVRRAIEKAC